MILEQNTMCDYWYNLWHCSLVFSVLIEVYIVDFLPWCQSYEPHESDLLIKIEMFYMFIIFINVQTYMCYFISCWERINVWQSRANFNKMVYYKLRRKQYLILIGDVVVVIVWKLDLQLSMQSVYNTTKVVNSNPIHGEVYSIQHYMIKSVSAAGWWFCQGTPVTSTNKTVRHVYNWNIVESGVKQNNPIQVLRLSINSPTILNDEGLIINAFVISL